MAASPLMIKLVCNDTIKKVVLRSRIMEELRTKIAAVFPELGPTYDLVTDGTGTMITSDADLHGCTSDSLRVVIRPRAAETLGGPLRSIIREEVDKIRTDIRALVQSEVSTQFVPVVHPGVACSVCRITPIVGCRYRCPECREEYNLCEQCERTDVHSQHAMLKISRPEPLVPREKFVPAASVSFDVTMEDIARQRANLHKEPPPPMRIRDEYRGGYQQPHPYGQQYQSQYEGGMHRFFRKAKEKVIDAMMPQMMEYNNYKCKPSWNFSSKDCDECEE